MKSYTIVNIVMCCLELAVIASGAPNRFWVCGILIAAHWAGYAGFWIGRKTK